MTICLTIVSSPLCGGVDLLIPFNKYSVRDDGVGVYVVASGSLPQKTKLSASSRISGTKEHLVSFDSLFCTPDRRSRESTLRAIVGTPYVPTVLPIVGSMDCPIPGCSINASAVWLPPATRSQLFLSVSGSPFTLQSKCSVCALQGISRILKRSK